VPQWGQAFLYDGFGNLTDKSVTKGSAPVWHGMVDPATNRASGYVYDANGNATSPSLQNAFDIENRIVSQTAWVQSSQYLYNYGYDPDNRRVYKATSSYDPGSGGYTLTGEEVTFWSPAGQRMGTYTLVVDPGGNGYGPTLSFRWTNSERVYFGSRLMWRGGSAVYTDRLGSVGKYFPYGEERPAATGGDGEKFATYFRDGATGLDYAVNRYYDSGTGRFLTADPSGMDTVNLSDPGSWNMYAYVGNDPINFNDPEGLIKCAEAPRLETGQTFGQLMNADDDVGLLARVVWAESDNGAYNGFQTQAYFDEKAAVAVSIVNRVDILNYKILVSDGRGGYINPGVLGWGPVNATLSQVLSQPGQYASIINGDISQAFRNSLNKVLNEDATSTDCIALINSWQAAYYAEEHILRDPFGDEGVTTSFHHGMATGSLEPYFGTFKSPNNFFGIVASQVVYNPSGTPPPSPSRRPRPPRHRVQ
jgi:RHS repeat-associated protein